MVSYTILPACLPVCLTPVVQSPDRVLGAGGGGRGGWEAPQASCARRVRGSLAHCWKQRLGL